MIATNIYADKLITFFPKKIPRVLQNFGGKAFIVKHPVTA